MNKSYVNYVISAFLVGLLSGCGGSTPDVPKHKGSATLDIFEQKLSIPEELQSTDVLKKKRFRADYENKKITYNSDRKEDTIITDDYEMLYFNEFIYVKHIVFNYEECRRKSALGEAMKVFDNIVLAPTTLLGTALGRKPQTITASYRVLRVQDYTLMEILESDNDNLLGCEFDFKYTGFTNHLKIKFEEILNYNYIAKDLLEYSSIKNDYDVSYFDTQSVFNIIDYNLKQRKDVALNEKIAEELAKLQDQRMFSTLRQNRSLYHMQKYTLLELPSDCDFAFMAKDGRYLMKMGLYQDTKAYLKPYDDSFEAIDYGFVELAKPEIPLDAQKSSLKQYYAFEDKFVSFAQSLEEIWNEMSDLRASQNIKNKKDEAHNDKDEYAQIREELQKKYNEYKTNSDEYTKKLDEALSQIDKYEHNLGLYFQYQNYSQAKTQYQDYMQEKFGHYIEPSRWCEAKKCPQRDAIIRVINEEANKKWYEKSQGLPPKLTFIEFVKHERVRSEVTNKIKEKFKGYAEVKPIHFEEGFDAYRVWRNDLIVSNAFDEIDRHLKELEAYKFIPLKELLSATSWKDFVYKPSITKKLLEVCGNEALAKKLQKELSDKEKNIKNLYPNYIGAL